MLSILGFVLASIGDFVGGVAGFQPTQDAAGQKPVFDLFEKDGVLRIQQEGAEQSHPLADAHCDACSSAFNILKKKSETGFDPNKLFAMAVEQTNRRQKILGAVAKPGQGPLEGLSSTGGIRGTDPQSAAADRQREDSVELSRSARRRAQIRPDAASQVIVGRSTAETQQPDDGPASMTASEAQLDKGGSGPTQVPGAEPGQDRGHSDFGRDGGQSGSSGTDGGQDESATGDGHSESGADHGHADAKNETKRAPKKSHDQQELSSEEQARVTELVQRDAEVRAHEQAHKSAAGGHSGAISLSYETGPDGKRYAVAGEVPVDISPVKGDPSATIQKMQTIQRAALAPADPSSADRRVASRARQYANQARMDLQIEQREAQSHPGFNKGTNTSKESTDRETRADLSTQKAAAPQAAAPQAAALQAAAQDTNKSAASSDQRNGPVSEQEQATNATVNEIEKARPKVGQTEDVKPAESASGLDYSTEERDREQAIVDQATQKPISGPQNVYGRRGFSGNNAVSKATFNLFG